MLRAATNAMGTRFELALFGKPDRHLRAVADEIIAEITRLHVLWSRFEPASIISLINRAAHLRPVRVDAETFNLLTLAEHIRTESGGAFNVAIAHLMDRSTAVAEPDAPHPPHAHLDPSTQSISLLFPAQIDLGAIAKGAALDRAAELLAEFDIPAALIHAGTSSILARGVPPDAQTDGWPIAIRSAGAHTTVILHDQALGVSAPRGRWLDAAQSQGHILDPRTGQSAAAFDTACAILPAGPNASSLADAWSTAALVLGESIFTTPPAFPPHATILTHDAARAWRTLSPATLAHIP